MSVLTLEDVKDYLGYDEIDKMTASNITRTISTAEKYLQGAIGKGFHEDDPRVQELALRTVADLYENRTHSAKSNATVSKLTNDFAMQLRLELEAEKINGV